MSRVLLRAHVWKRWGPKRWRPTAEGEALSLRVACLCLVHTRSAVDSEEEFLHAQSWCARCSGRGLLPPGTPRTPQQILSLAARGSLTPAELLDLQALNRLAALGVPW